MVVVERLQCVSILFQVTMCFNFISSYNVFQCIPNSQCVSIFLQANTLCGGVFRQTSGSINFKNSDNKDKGHVVCYWIIHASANTKIDLKILRISMKNDVSCNMNFLKVSAEFTLNVETF